MELEVVKELLSGGADLATIIFLYLLWRLDRRLLVVEQSIKSLWHRFNNHKDTEGAA